ncbi:MAG TPA: protein kinase [Candidatus Polarisedimenticolia bacterium]|nr:protein kinase [Candidatus Polarisedimenticolia bacterium]
MPLEPGKMLAHYRILSEIGRGGMGVVYEAADTTLDRRIALKVLPEEATANPDRLLRFRREARVVAALNHPGIVTIHSVEEAEGIHFLTMELVRGKTLHERIPAGGLPADRIFGIAIPLAEALSAAHERGVIHRDLKPSNVLVTEEGRIKVLDFGLAKLATAEESSGDESILPTRSLLTGEGRRLGTFPYMSPEQVMGRALDHRSDIFSFGIVLYEMATGTRPFSGSSTAELASSILRDTPEPVIGLRPDLPGHFAWILRRCLEKDPRRRYQSALDIRNEMEDLEKGIVSEVPISRPPVSRSAWDSASVSGAPAASAPTPAPAASPASGPVPGAASKKQSAPVGYLVFAGFIVLLLFALLWMNNRDRARRRAAVSPPAGSAAAVTPGVASLAILPFVNISADPENEYFSDGMTEQLINALVKVEGLKVPARTTVFALKAKNLDVQEIGKRLGVDSVLEGSVRKSASRLRINVRLARTSDGSALWSEQYDRELKDVFAVQDEISRKIVETLRVRLSPLEAQALARAPTGDSEAYDLYLKGRRLFFLSGRRNLGNARETFSRAIDLDPGFALAYAGIADASSWLYLYSEATGNNLEEAKKASLKALELAPDLAEAHASRGLALSLSTEHEAAGREFETAIRLDPRLFEAYYFYARDCWARGKWDQATHLFGKAMEVRPEDYQAPALMSNALRQLGRSEEATAMEKKGLEIIRARLETDPDDTRALYLGANVLVKTGAVDEGLEWIRRAIAVDPSDPATLYNAACVFSKAGKKQEAIGSLEKAVAVGFAHKAWIENDSDLDSIRGDPRYQTLLKHLR